MKAESMEEARARNIARNNQFLKELMGSAAKPIPNPLCEPGFSSSLARESRPSGVFSRPVSHCIQACLKCNNAVMLRNSQIKETITFLNEKVRGVPKPALIHIGPGGSGKTLVCRTALKAMDCEFATIECNGFRSSKQLLMVSFAAVKSCMERMIERLKVKLSLDTESSASVSKFSDLSLAVGKLIESVIRRLEVPVDPGRKPKERIVSGFCIHILLDRADSLFLLDEALARNMLMLSKNTHPSIKVFATMERLHCKMEPYSFIPVYYPAYIESHIKLMLVKRLKGLIATLLQQMLQEHPQKPSAQSEEMSCTKNKDESGAKGGQQEPTHETESICKSSSPAADSPPDVSVRMLDVPFTSDTRIYSETTMQCIAPVFSHLLGAALPSFMMVTSHPDELWAAAVSAWTVLFAGHSLADCIRAVLAHVTSCRSGLSVLAGDGVSESNGGGITNPERSCSDLWKTLGAKIPNGNLPTIPQPTLREIREAVGVVQHFPSFSCGSAALHRLGEQRCIMGLQRSMLVKDLVAGSVGEEKQQTNAAYRASTNEASELQSISSDSMRMKGWSDFCPPRVKYLIIAAYLAGINPKESDNLKLVADRAGRRKKPRLGADPDQEVAPVAPSAPSASSASFSSGAGALSRFFSLERLMSIYAQVAGIITHRVPRNYGDVPIYSMVRSPN